MRGSTSELAYDRPVTLAYAVLIVVVVAGLAITCMLLVRRTAPEGSYFADGDRASGVFGVLATGFAVLIGFVVFLAFESFDTSRSGAEAEARTVAQQMEAAQFMPAGSRAALSGELICYARFVVHEEWPEMRAGTLGDSLNPWGIATFKTLRTIEPRTASEQAAYSKWLDQRSDRENARADRAHGAEGVIPATLWIVLFLSAGIIFIFMMFFADSAERRIVQATMIGGVAVVISSTFVLLWFLDNPYHKGVGGLTPVAMERTLRQLPQEVAVAKVHPLITCDANGVPRG
jgi:amino acid transporter